MSHTKPKGQVSMEFFSLIAVMLLIFVIYTPFFWQQQLDIETEKEYLVGEKIVTSVKKEINTAVMFGSGYRRNFTLPEEISHSDYTMTISKKILKMAWKDRTTEENLIAHNVTGNPKPGLNTIENRDDVIYINQG
jgi:uncharacterized protein (UPF0333 family)